MRSGARLALRLLVLTAGLLPWVLAASGVRSAGLVAVFHTLCHQRPERTLSIHGVPMLVCSRCAGLYAGLALGALAPLPRRAVAHGRALVLGAVALTVLEVGAQDLVPHAPWHATRLLTGLALGWTASAFFTASLQRVAAKP